MKGEINIKLMFSKHNEKYLNSEVILEEVISFHIDFFKKGLAKFM